MMTHNQQSGQSTSQMIILNLDMKVAMSLQQQSRPSCSHLMIHLSLVKEGYEKKSDIKDRRLLRIPPHVTIQTVFFLGQRQMLGGKSFSQRSWSRRRPNIWSPCHTAPVAQPALASCLQGKKQNCLRLCLFHLQSWGRESAIHLHPSNLSQAQERVGQVTNLLHGREAALLTLHFLLQLLSHQVFPRNSLWK